MARQKARAKHAIEDRKRKYKIKIDGGLHDRIADMAKSNEPRFKHFRDVWDKMDRLEREQLFDQMKEERQSQMVVNFVKVAAALLKKYDDRLANPEKEAKHPRAEQHLKAVFRIVISNKLQTLIGKTHTESFKEVEILLERITDISKRRNMPANFLHASI